MNKYLFLDCDSTLCAIEGVDELAALRGPEIEKQVIYLTNEAMDGTVPIDEIFGRRLELIAPNRSMCEEVAQMYIERLTPNAEDVLSRLQESGWECIIISGGFTQVIAPVAAHLGIKEIFAVNLSFSEDGNYQSFDNQSPTSRNGGKPEIIEDFLKDKLPHQSVMVGDGISDLETEPAVDLFIGYGGVVSRDKVRSQSKAFIHNFTELPGVMAKYL